MQEALIFSSSHPHFIVPKQKIERYERLSSDSLPQKRLTPENLQHIQQSLDKGLSNRESATLEGFSEYAVRYWITKGKLEKRVQNAMKNRKKVR